MTLTTDRLTSPGTGHLRIVTHRATRRHLHPDPIGVAGLAVAAALDGAVGGLDEGDRAAIAEPDRLLVRA